MDGWRQDRFLHWAIVVGAVFLVACGNRYNTQFTLQPDVLAQVQVVAVLPLENLSETAEGGQAVTDLLVTELADIARFRVLGRVELEQLFARQQVEIPKVIDRAIAAEIGRRIGADAVFIGSVTEYLYRSDSSTGEEEEPAFGVNLRLVHSRSGTVIWGSSHARSSYETFSYEKDALTRVAARALQEMLGPLRKT